MKVVYFNFAAVAVLLLIFLTALMRKVINSRANRSFLFAVGEVFLTTMFLIWAAYLDNAGAGNVTEKYIAHGAYLYLHTVSSLFYLSYLISLTDSWHLFRKSVLKKTVFMVPLISITIVFIAQFFLPVKTFYINEADVYTRGPLFLFNYFIGGIYMAYGIYYIFKYRKMFTTNWILTLFSPFPFIGLAMVIEFFHPALNIELFFNALGLLFIFVNIQKPEELMDTTTGVGNFLSFSNVCTKAAYNQKPMTVILADLSNYESIKNMLDYEGNIKIRKSIADYLVSINKSFNLKGQIFYGRKGRFYIISEVKDEMLIDGASSKIYEDLNDPNYFSALSVSPHTSICVIKLPEDFTDMELFMRFCKKDLFPEGKLSYAGELLKDQNNRIRLNIDKIMVDALANGGLEVYYQPIYSFEENRITSAEALLRLKDPDYGFVSPDIFITRAEQNGNIFPIWDFVIKSVCEFISGEDFAKLGLDYIEVNLSAVQCVQENMAESILDTIKSYNFDHRRISLEITETALVYGEDILAKNLGRLHDEGMLICLDDYGTGYSNTRRIMDLPIDICKLDKSFLEGIESENIQRIIWNSVNMLKAEGMHIVAEGVETERVLHELKLCDVDLIQGYYFSRPLPQKDFVEYVANSKF